MLDVYVPYTLAGVKLCTLTHSRGIWAERIVSHNPHETNRKFPCIALTFFSHGIKIFVDNDGIDLLKFFCENFRAVGRQGDPIAVRTAPGASLPTRKFSPTQRASSRRFVGLGRWDRAPPPRGPPSVPSGPPRPAPGGLSEREND